MVRSEMEMFKKMEEVLLDTRGLMAKPRYSAYYKLCRRVMFLTLLHCYDELKDIVRTQSDPKLIDYFFEKLPIFFDEYIKSPFSVERSHVFMMEFVLKCKSAFLYQSDVSPLMKNLRKKTRTLEKDVLIKAMLADRKDSAKETYDKHRMHIARNKKS